MMQKNLRGCPDRDASCRMSLPWWGVMKVVDTKVSGVYCMMQKICAGVQIEKPVAE
jgi:hypothetical protein